MISYISASYVYPVSSAPLEEGVIALDANGLILEILTAAEAVSKGITDIKFYEGILVPGFVNTHCHLELSHLKGKIDKHTGLPGFVEQVIRQRQAKDEEVVDAMEIADRNMYAQGIVAVADISNQLISKEVKEISGIYYHTFIEAMGFNPGKAADIIEAAKIMKKAFQPLNASIVPHAPYSVSDNLFNEIRKEGEVHQDLISIHNQETPEENEFFEYKSGSFLKLYEFLGLNIDFFKATGRSSLQSYLPKLSPSLKTLLVHNTFSSSADLDFAKANHPALYWCLCPNANLYIENKLPALPLFLEAGVKITLGTDSLASNDQLSIVAEMRTLQQHFQLPLAQLLSWATINGAEFLGIEDRFGSLVPGKTPGINLLEYVEKDGEMWITGQIKRLA
ncbi:amidohydrolase family protein [Pedobacter gandavensis]|uniref:Amidohydrolase family protein n=1 Tax=Pedobacter gandavensis TaxID=2679963 RepID=A0ABR6EXD1_9SPHI|nr:amidohydrolase family protein [Pedobacter gandavensis]MBB2149857.1 amidohydrolase family protein [Pedobacter gandavensis]